jgi:hypothetical protein
MRIDSGLDTVAGTEGYSIECMPVDLRTFENLDLRKRGAFKIDL